MENNARDLKFVDVGDTNVWPIFSPEIPGSVDQFLVDLYISDVHVEFFLRVTLLAGPEHRWL